MMNNGENGKRSATRALTLLLVVAGDMVALVHGQEVRHIKTGQAQNPEIMIMRGHGERPPVRQVRPVIKPPAPLSPSLKQSLLRASGYLIRGQVARQSSRDLYSNYQRFQGGDL